VYVEIAGESGRPIDGLRGGRCGDNEQPDLVPATWRPTRRVTAQQTDRLSGLEVGDCIGHITYPMDSEGNDLSSADLTYAQPVACSSRGAQLKVISTATASTGMECSDPSGRIPGSLLYRFTEPTTGTTYCLNFLSG
jgi:hypothetical protein